MPNKAKIGFMRNKRVRITKQGPIAPPPAEDLNPHPLPDPENNFDPLPHLLPPPQSSLPSCDSEMNDDELR